MTRRPDVASVGHIMVEGQHHYLVAVPLLPLVAYRVVSRTFCRNETLGFAVDGHVAVVCHGINALLFLAFTIRKIANRKYRKVRFKWYERYVGNLTHTPISQPKHL